MKIHLYKINLFICKSIDLKKTLLDKTMANTKVKGRRKLEHLKSAKTRLLTEFITKTSNYVAINQS